MWLEYWGGALCDETKTAERETRLRGFYWSEGEGEFI